MKIIAPYAYFAPEKAASSYLWQNLHESFADNDLDCVVYVPTPTRGISEETRSEYAKKRLELLYDGKLTINRFHLFAEGRNPLLRAFRYILSCTIQLQKCLIAKSSKDGNLIFVVSTPPILGIVGILVKKIRNIPFVYNLQDIFPDSLVGTGLAPKGGFLWKIGRVIENFTYRNADKIIVISEDFKKNIMAKGVPEEKIEVIYNWVDQDAVVDIPRAENKLFDKYGLDRNMFYITYNGNIGLTQNMDMLLEVAKELSPTPTLPRREGESSPTLALPRREGESSPTSALPRREGESPVGVQGEREIHFVLVGEGAYKAEVEKRIKEQGITNVTLLPFQPYEDISHVFSLGDVSLVISKPGVGANSVPSKTWSIMSASRPVLANFDENELKTIIEEHHCGIFTKAGDKEAFKEAILKLYHNSELCKEYGRNGRQFVMENLTKEVGTRKYVEVIRSFAPQG